MAEHEFTIEQISNASGIIEAKIADLREKRNQAYPGGGFLRSAFDATNQRRDRDMARLGAMNEIIYIILGRTLPRVGLLSEGPVDLIKE